ITPAFFKNTRWLAAIMLIVLFYFTNYCVSPIFNTMGTTLYNMDVTQVSQYIVWAFIVAAVFGTTSGWIVGKIGRTTAIVLASLLMICGFVGSALCVNTD
ncbi:MFS transporter, partial [Salmonella enterica subsp. enterica serovar Istanbul]|nr:MFS transporter [Salmonella enterica subsp. enterica serovar Istanbul]